MRFVGIDLAWKVTPPRDRGTGLCIIEDDGEVSSIGSVTTDQEALDLVEGDELWVGVDAPLRVPENKVIRKCERELRSMGVRILPSGRRFHDRHYGGSRGVGLVPELERRGLEYFGKGDRSFFEVYPHAVLCALSPPPRPKYKKGPAALRQEGSAKVLDLLSRWEPSLRWSPEIGGNLTLGEGAADRLDALLAAVSLYRHRLYSGERSLVLGDDDDGYILLPREGGKDGS